MVSWLCGSLTVLYSVPFQLLGTCWDRKKSEMLVHPQTSQPLSCSLTQDSTAQCCIPDTFVTKVNGCLIWKLCLDIVGVWSALQSQVHIILAFGKTERKAVCQ